MSTATVDPPVVTRVARSELRRALRAAASIKAKAVHLTLGDTLHVDAYTPDVAIHTTVEGAGGNGETFIVGRVQLAAVLTHCDGMLALHIEGGRLIVTSPPSRFSLAPSEDAILVGKYTHDFAGGSLGDPVAVIDAAVLTEALRRALPHAGSDYTRPLLCVVALAPRRGTIAATDSYRLAIVQYGDDQGPSDEAPVLLQRDGAASIRTLLAKKLGPVSIRERAAHITVTFDDIEWSLLRVTGKYPNYLSLLPDDDQYGATLVIDRDDLLAGARAAADIAEHNEPVVLVTGETTQVHCGHGPNSMTRELASAAKTGKPLDAIGVNPRFLSEVCASAPAERLTMRFISPRRPMVVGAGRDTYLLMPIRLNV